MRYEFVLGAALVASTMIFMTPNQALASARSPGRQIVQTRGIVLADEETTNGVDCNFTKDGCAFGQPGGDPSNPPDMSPPDPGGWGVHASHGQKPECSNPTCRGKDAATGGSTSSPAHSQTSSGSGGNTSGNSAGSSGAPPPGCGRGKHNGTQASASPC